MFERTLESLIKGLRSHRGADEASFVATLLDEIRNEVRSGDMQVKAGAVLKLTYVSVDGREGFDGEVLANLEYCKSSSGQLQMLGYPPASYSSFPILEVMASPQYHFKQVGYLAATQSFHQETDVLILATNLIKKVSLGLTIRSAQVQQDD